MLGRRDEIGPMEETEERSEIERRRRMAMGRYRRMNGPRVGGRSRPDEEEEDEGESEVYPPPLDDHGAMAGASTWDLGSERGRKERGSSV